MAWRGLFIGEVAEQAGTNPKTIRYYETVGVLPAFPTSVVGFPILLRPGHPFPLAADRAHSKVIA